MSKKEVSGFFEPRQHLSRDKDVPYLVRSGDRSSRPPAVFYRTERGNEPVRDWMKKEMSREDRIKVNTDIRAVELCWPIGMPLCRPLSRGLWEIRTNLQDRVARVIFCAYNDQIVLLHGFIKKSREISHEDMELAFQRKRRLMRAK
jgi:phage-related protein